MVVSPKRSAKPGDEIRADFRFSNLGGAPATGVRVRIALPPGVTHVANSDLVDDAPLAEGETLVATGGAALADVDPNAERRVSCLFRVNDTIEDGSDLVFQAALASDQTPLVASNIERVTVRSAPLLENTSTLVTISAPDAPKPGDTITVRATIGNTGQSSAHDVLVMLPLPEYASYVQRSARIGGRVLLNVVGEPFDYASETVAAHQLAPGQSVVVEYQATIASPLPDGTRIKVQGVVSSRECAEFEIASAEIVVTSPVNFENDETALTVFCDDIVTPGMRVPMLVRAVNTGTGTAQNVSITFDLPNGLVYTPGSATVDGQAVADDTVPSATFSLGSLASGRVVEVGLATTVVIPSTGEVTLPIGAALRWKHGERHFARRLTIRVAPRFTRTRNFVEVDRSIVPSRDEVVYTAHVFNDGTAPEHNVQLRVIPGAFLEDVRVAEGADEPVPYGEPLVLGAVAPQSERIFTIHARVASPVPDRSQVTLGAVLDFEAGAFDLGVATIVVRSRPHIDPERCAWELLSPGPLRPNHTADFVIRFSNEGSDALRDAHMDLLLPPELTLERAQNARRDRNTLHFGDILAESSHEAHVTIRLNRPPKRDRMLAIEGALYGRGISPIQFASLDIETYAEPEFTENAELVAVPVEHVNAGERVIYEIRLHNSGDGPAEELVVRAVPTNLAVYVPGSTSLNGLGLPDDLGTSQIWSQRGLMLTDVNPAMDLRVRWEMIVMAPLAAGTAIETRAVVTWDGQKTVALAAPVLRVVSTPSLEATTIGTPISVAQIFPSPLPLPPPEATTEELPPPPLPGPPVAEEPAVPRALREVVEREQPTLAPSVAPAPPREQLQPIDEPAADVPIAYIDLSQEDVTRTIRQLEKSDVGGLIMHVFALRFLFPERIMGASRELERTAATAAKATRAPLERLFARLTNPRLTITGKELEDRDSRFALRALVGELIDAPPSQLLERPANVVRISGRVDVQPLRALAPELETAPLGAVVPWIVNAHLLGTSIDFDGRHSDALAQYRSELLTVFSLLETLPLPEFHRVLGTSVNRTLDEALAAVLDALRTAAHIAVE